LPEAVKNYWKAAAGKAKSRYLERQGLGPAVALSSMEKFAQDAESDKHLIQVNIEGVETAFTESLDGVWAAVKSYKQVDRERVRPQKDFDTPPKGPGWVVELRGFTYHGKHEYFVMDTLVENLARMSRTEASPTSGGGAAAANKAENKDDAITNRISHVVLLETRVVSSNAPLLSSRLSTIVSSSGSTKGGTSST